MRKSILLSSLFCCRDGSRKKTFAVFLNAAPQSMWHYAMVTIFLQARLNYRNRWIIWKIIHNALFASIPLKWCLKTERLRLFFRLSRVCQSAKNINIILQILQKAISSRPIPWFIDGASGMACQTGSGLISARPIGTGICFMPKRGALVFCRI